MSNQLTKELKKMFDRIRDPEKRAEEDRKKRVEKRNKRLKEDYGL